MTDPLEAFMGHRRGGKRPVPLVSTSFSVEVEGGLVVVSTRRVFRNVEALPIEAVLTFPVPVHATLFALEARLGERLLVAKAQRRDAARETYEDALAEGRAAILHEEVLRGVHMLSVAPLGPDAEIEVTGRWVATLSFIDGSGQIRIPTTVGDIYGDSGLPDSDDLVHRSEADWAELTVRSQDGVVELLGGALVDGCGRVRLDAPIDLVVRDPQPGSLRGVSADGREVQLRLTPHEGEERALSLAILLDRSGSMDSPASGAFGPASSHQAAVAALAALAPSLGGEDYLDVWEFDCELDRVGATSSAPGFTVRDSFRALVGKLGEPRGGTEIGRAVSGTLAGSPARDLLLITDGKSHALDVQALARLGCRISVLLVGEDSLEANVGHLAALTGGDLFVAMETDFARPLAAAVKSMRLASQPPVEAEDGCWLRIVRRGALVHAEWGPERLPDPALVPRAVAAFAASQRLATLDEDGAAALAAREGLATHLTSLVLVDHDGTVVDGIPVMRKIALPTPRTSAASAGDLGPSGLVVKEQVPGPMSVEAAADQVEVSRKQMRSIEARMLRKLFHPSRSRKLRMFLDDTPPSCQPDLPTGGLRLSDPAEPQAPRPLFGWELLHAMCAGLDWDSLAQPLAVGDLSRLDAALIKAIVAQAARADVLALADRLGIDPLLFVVAVLARRAAGPSRSAARVERKIFRGFDPEAVRSATEALPQPRPPKLPPS